MFEPTWRLELTVRPVLAFVNDIIFDTTFPAEETCSKVWSWVSKFEGSIFLKSLFTLLTYTQLISDSSWTTCALGISFARPTPVTDMIPSLTSCFRTNPKF